MSDRNQLISMFGFACLLALLAWVPASSDSPTGLTSSPSQPNGPHRSTHQPTASLLVAIVSDADLFANDLPIDTEDQDGTRVEERDQTKAATEPRAAFRIACTFHAFRDRQAVTPPRAISLYPLRC